VLFDVELPERFVVARRHRAQGAPVEVTKDAAPEQIRLLLKVDIIRLDDLNEGQLHPRSCNHDHHLPRLVRRVPR